jgi:hypothetical protein
VEAADRVIRRKGNAAAMTTAIIKAVNTAPLLVIVEERGHC